MGATVSANRLIDETSPYLRQHAHNPVDWYPWGPEALRRAREEDRPIFLSIGYAACHWCHVMERESFDNIAVAHLMNENFVNIKVDREERPDLDALYMNAVELLTGAGGWPASLWLTPELKPFYAGTYFPPEDRWGRPGFLSVLTEVARAYRERREEVEHTADEVAQALRELEVGTAGPRELDPALVRAAVAALRDRFDPMHGGFGTAPKFPSGMALSLILRRYRREPDPALLRLVTLTLEEMARGGIYDQIGGGFHRYATDDRWLVPHFEKMLYDNALLAPVYLEAYEITGEPLYRRVAAETLDWVRREMTHPEGGFFSTLDADSEGEEGKFYLWTPAAVVQVLGSEDGALFNRIYDITERGNFEGCSIPHLHRSLAEWAGELQTDPDAFQGRVNGMRERLRAARAGRVWPLKDDKILTGWNGLMITAFARAAVVLGSAEDARRGERAAAFVLERMQVDGRLQHTYREGEARLPAFQDDYAFLAQGLLELHAATGNARWRDAALALVRQMVDLFWDEAEGGFFFTARDQETPIVRGKNPYDGAIPSGNSTAALVLLRLAEQGEDAGFAERARRTLTAFRDLMERAPDGFHRMLAAVDAYLERPGALPAGTALPDVVGVEATLAPDAARPGEELQVILRLHIREGWHVNARQTAAAELAPTVVEIHPERDLRVLRVRYPEAQALPAPLAAGALAVYTGEVEVAADLQVEPGACPGESQIIVRVSYQPCGADRCLLPVEKTVTIPVRLAE